MKQFDITYFHGPWSEHIVKEECIKDMANSGITLSQLLYTSTEANKKALPLLKKYGMRASIFEDRIRETYRKKDISLVDAVVKEVVEDYAEFDNINGWEIADEPSSKDFPVLKAFVDAFRRYDPERETVINLFPTYATPEMLKDPDYVTHIERFVDEVKPDFISYDHYPFMGRVRKEKLSDPNQVDDERERLIRLASEAIEDRDDFFENLEIARRTGLKNDIEQMVILMVTEHGSCRNITRQEILWEVNMSLAYGMHRISYFTYWLPNQDENDRYWLWDNAMCDREGNKYQHYYDVQAVNKLILPIGKMLFETKSKAVFHVGKQEKGTTPFTRYEHVKEIVGDNAVVGFFEDGSVYLVNRDFVNENTLTICADKEFVIYENGDFVSTGKNKTITLSAGAAVLLKW